MSLLENLGFQVDFDKSTLVPCQVVSYIRVTLNSIIGKAYAPPMSRSQEIHSLVCIFTTGAMVSAHKTQLLLGIMASTTTVISPVRFKMHSLLAWYLSLFNPLWDHPAQLL